MTALTRRALAGALAALAASTLAPRDSAALGRKPYGGALALKLPWPLDGIDPHAVDDVVAALFGAAIADPLFALDALGRPYPALAAQLPLLKVQTEQRVQRVPLQLAPGTSFAPADAMVPVAIG